MGQKKINLLVWVYRTFPPVCPKGVSTENKINLIECKPIH